MRPHVLPRADLEELLAARGSAAAVRRLADSEWSWRLQLLTALRRALTDAGRDYTDAWQLLGRAQRTAPGPVRELLLHPGVGTWAAHALRLVRGSAVSPHPGDVEPRRLYAVAAAAAAVAGLEGRLAVPAWQGTVSLPSLGLAVLADPGGAREEWSEAVVAFGGGAARVAGAAEWLPLRQLGIGTAVLDDVDPYRGLLRAELPQRLSDADCEEWRAVAEAGLEVLRQVDPDAAEAIVAGLRVVVPLAAAEPHRPRSASSGDAFGAVLASFPDSAEQFAATLVHEFAHNRLGALFHLQDFYAEGDGRLRYAPWRDDPRPLGGLLQGVYAFTAVARFWQARATGATSSPGSRPRCGGGRPGARWSPWRTTRR
ncbi:HEXXH motif-containing putative peptide modification protein [Streptacidiphilus monticola]